MAARDTDGFFEGTDDPMARLDEERRRLDDLGQLMEEGRTTVRAKDNAFSMTFNGRGDLAELTFHGTKYRSLAPTELAHRIVETLQKGRTASLEKMAETMDTDAVPGLDVVGLATGKVDPRKAVDALLAPLLQGMGAPGQEPRRDAGRG